MAHRRHRAGQARLHRHRGNQVQVVADHQVGFERTRHVGDGGRERSFEACHHIRCHIAIARGGVRHLIAHAAHGKRQVGRAIAHRMEQDALAKRRIVVRVDTRDHRDFVAGGAKRAHGLGQVHAAARAVRLLRADRQYPHGRLLLLSASHDTTRFRAEGRHPGRRHSAATAATPPKLANKARPTRSDRVPGGCYERRGGVPRGCDGHRSGTLSKRTSFAAVFRL